MNPSQAERAELTGVVGAPETVLSTDLLGRLPANESDAPWTVQCQAVVWAGRPGPAARAALAPQLGDARPVVVVGGLVRYFDTPVGRYDEVFGIVMCRESLRRTWGHVAFMAVDSLASIVGGRTHWAMPKTLASFSGSFGSGETTAATGDDTMTWRVAATPRAFGPALPVRSRAVTRQVFPGGRLGDSRLTAKGKAQTAIVDVDVTSEGELPAWLKGGRHLGAVVPSCSFTLGVPDLR